MSSNPSEDLDQVNMPASTATATPATTFKPTSPMMGGLHQVSSTEWCPWTGGVPKPDWSGLASSAPTAPTEAHQLRPLSPGSAQKSASFRETGLTTKCSRSTNLLEFIQEVSLHLKRTGMDTVSCLPDPDDPTKVLSVVTDSTRFALNPALETARDLRKTKFDTHDTNNDDTNENTNY